jgi:ribosomal protein L40E
MAEILTESFCERCGTRYTFEAAIPKKRRIGKLKVLSKGLRNYVLSDDASLDEALADARSEEQREVSGGQLDAFHQTFQFCMACRQYTCANCWNESEGRCLSCAPPSIGAGQLGSPFDDLLAGGGMAPLVSPLADPDGPAGYAPNGKGHAQLEEPLPQEVIGTAWPTIDLFRTAPIRPMVEDTPESVIETGPPVGAETWVEDPATVAAQAAAEQVAQDDAGPELQGAGGSSSASEDGAAPASAEGELSVDFWTRPFTGYAPIGEPANGHDPEAPPESVGPAAADVAATPDEAAVPPAPDDWQPRSSAAPIVEPDKDRIEHAVSLAAAAAPAVDIRPGAEADELAARTTRLLGRFRVQARSAAAAPAQPAPVMDTQLRPHDEATPEPAAEVAEAPQERGSEAQPQVPGPEAQPEGLIVARPEPEPASPTELPAEPVVPEPEPLVAITALTERPAWPTRIGPSTRDVTPAPTPLIPSAPAQAPQWPAPLRPGVDLSSPPFWASGDSGRVAREAALWTASAQEVSGAAGQPAVQAGVQSCISCGLSLSATARFCRRCGAHQS